MLNSILKTGNNEMKINSSSEVQLIIEGGSITQKIE